MEAGAASTPSEPRGLSMSLDDVIKEKRSKEGGMYRNSNRHARGGAHVAGNRSGGKQHYHYNNNNHNNKESHRVVQQHGPKSVRASYQWTTQEGIETMAVSIDNKELLTVSSNGDVLIRSGVEREWKVFTCINICLAPLKLKLFFDGDIKKDWTVKNEAGWNRILDNDVTVSAFPSRHWGFTKAALQQLPESISLQPRQQQEAGAGGRGGFVPPGLGLMGPMAGVMNPAAAMMNPMMMMMMMAQQQQMMGLGGGGAPKPPIVDRLGNAPTDSSTGRGAPLGREQQNNIPVGSSGGERGYKQGGRGGSYAYRGRGRGRGGY